MNGPRNSPSKEGKRHVMSTAHALTPKQESFCLAYPSFGEAFQRSPREDFNNHFVGRSAA